MEKLKELWLILVIVAVMVGGVGGFLYWQNEQNAAREQERLEMERQRFQQERQAEQERARNRTLCAILTDPIVRALHNCDN